MRTELPAFASFRQSGASCLSGLAITSREHLPGRAGQGRAGACSLRHGTTRAWLVQTMSIRRLPHAAHRQRSCTSGVSPRPVAMRPCEVGVALVFAAPAGQQNEDIAAVQRGPGRRQGVGHGGSITCIRLPRVQLVGELYMLVRPQGCGSVGKYVLEH
jgi:hypothetical protein